MRNERKPASHVRTGTLSHLNLKVAFPRPRTLRFLPSTPSTPTSRRRQNAVPKDFPDKAKAREGGEAEQAHPPMVPPKIARQNIL